ncbi:MAG: HPr family phosphocarrier protein [Clostridium sp.]
MKQKKIKLLTIEDAKRFVATAEKCDFDIDVFYNRIVIDAKSLLGVMSLDLTKVLTVEYSGENSDFEILLEDISAKTVAA